MFYHFWLTLHGCFIILLLSACGNSSGTNSSTENASPGTRSNGPISISTDHTVYKSTEHIQVAILTTLTTPIYALDTQASCSILGLEIQINNQWRPSSVARCSLGRPATLVRVEPGKAYKTTLQADSPGNTKTKFPAGKYRLIFNYSLANDIQSILSNPTTVYSMTFSIINSDPIAAPTDQPTSIPPPTP